MKENLNNNKEYTAKRGLMNFFKRKQFFALLIIVIAFVFYVTFYISKGDEQQLTQKQIPIDIPRSPEQQLVQNLIPNQISAGWGLYQNQELGVAFQYPLSWGSIKQGFVSTGCVSKDKVYGGTEYMDYTEEVYNQIKKEMALAPQDPCRISSLGVMAENEPNDMSRVIFGTMSPLYMKYPVQGMGPPWYAIAGLATSKEFVENLCIKSSVECLTFTNKQGVLISREQFSNEMHGVEGAVNYIHSPNNIYSGIVMSSAELSEEQQKDFGSVIDSLHFIK